MSIPEECGRGGGLKGGAHLGLEVDGLKGNGLEDSEGEPALPLRPPGMSYVEVKRSLTLEMTRKHCGQPRQRATAGTLPGPYSGRRGLMGRYPIAVGVVLGEEVLFVGTFGAIGAKIEGHLGGIHSTHATGDFHNVVSVLCGRGMD